MEKKRDIYFKTNKKGKHVSGVLNFLRIIFVPFFRLIFPFRFYGNKKVPDGACVYIGNHYRIWDIVYPAMTTWEGIHFIAKKSVSKNPFMHFFCKTCKTIDVSRDGTDAKAVIEAIKCLKNGEKISLFPEGTRNKTDAEMLPFKAGATVFAIRTKTPIVPIMQYKKAKPFQIAHIIIGEPFELSEYYDRKLTQEEYEEADRKLYDKLISMRREHEQYLANRKKKCK